MWRVAGRNRLTVVGTPRASFERLSSATRRALIRNGVKDDSFRSKNRVSGCHVPDQYLDETLGHRGILIIGRGSLVF